MEKETKEQRDIRKQYEAMEEKGEATEVQPDKANQREKTRRS
jgi:hypothetical protein